MQKQQVSLPEAGVALLAAGVMLAQGTLIGILPYVRFLHWFDAWEDLRVPDTAMAMLWRQSLCGWLWVMAWFYVQFVLFGKRGPLSVLLLTHMFAVAATVSYWLYGGTSVSLMLWWGGAHFWLMIGAAMLVMPVRSDS